MATLPICISFEFISISEFRPHGTRVVKQVTVAALTASRTEKIRTTKHLMKAITTKEFVSLVIIAITAPVLALALFAGARAMAAGNESLLLALTLCGAVVSGFNGFGRRTANVEGHSRRGRRGSHSKVALTS